VRASAEWVIEYESRLVEEAVLLALRGGTEERAFRRQRDPLYGLADPEARDAGFRAFHAAWFERLGLDREIAHALQEQPSIAASTSRCLIAHASLSRDEGAELFVSADNEAPEAFQRAVVIRLRPETLTRPDGLRLLLRHELFHIADILDPRFGYAPALPVTDAGPSHERILRDRYRVLWDAHIDGRLSRLGWALAEIRADRLGEFARAFPMLGDLTEALFDRFFSAPSLSHADLVAFAVDPEGMLDRSSGGRRTGGSCPLCRFPTHVFEPEPDRLPRAVREQIRSDFPAWESAIGLCLQCADLYRARLLSPSSPTP